MSGRWPVWEPTADAAPAALFIRTAAALGLGNGCTRRRQAAQATAVQGDHGMRGIQSREGRKPCTSSSSVVAMAAAAPWPKRALTLRRRTTPLCWRARGRHGAATGEVVSGIEQRCGGRDGFLRQRRLWRVRLFLRWRGKERERQSEQERGSVKESGRSALCSWARRCRPKANVRTTRGTWLLPVVGHGRALLQQFKI